MQTEKRSMIYDADPRIFSGMTLKQANHIAANFGYKVVSRSGIMTLDIDITRIVVETSKGKITNIHRIS